MTESKRYEGYRSGRLPNGSAFPFNGATLADRFGMSLIGIRPHINSRNAGGFGHRVSAKAFKEGTMAIAHAAWTHGHSVSAHRGIPVQREGPHARVALFPGDNWLHFAIPTPVIVNDRRLRAESVLLNFSTGDGTVIKDVHVYDGDNLISRFDNVNSRSGLGVWQMDRWRIASPPEVFLAIGISVNAVVSGDGAEQPFVVLGAAGCDFIE